jgi:ribosomal protein L20
MHQPGQNILRVSVGIRHRENSEFKGSEYALSGARYHIIDARHADLRVWRKVFIKRVDVACMIIEALFTLATLKS